MPLNDRDILRHAASDGVKALLMRNRDLRFGTYEDLDVTFITRAELGRLRPVQIVICQITWWYKGHLCRVIDWSSMNVEFQYRGNAVNVDDTSPHCRFIRRSSSCADEVETAVEKVISRFRLTHATTGSKMTYSQKTSPCAACKTFVGGRRTPPPAHLVRVSKTISGKSPMGPADEATYKCRDCATEWLNETGSQGYGWVRF
jgi:hypothetical protein